MNSDQVRPIESSSNPQFKMWKSCLDSKGIKKNKIALLSGKKLVDEFLDQQMQNAIALIGPSDTQAGPITTYALANTLFKELDSLGTDSPLLAIKADDLPQWAEDEALGAEVFLALQDPGNLGAAIRLCEAFHVNKVVCLKECAHPFHPKSLKASAGSALRMNLQSGPSIHDLPALKLDFIGLDKSGTPIKDFQWPQNFRLVLGEEGPGLPSELKLKSLQIPINPQVESLNASTALGIALAFRPA